MNVRTRSIGRGWVIAVALLHFGAALAAADDPIDFNKAGALLQKQRQGQQLTEDEAAYLQRAREARRGQQPAGSDPRPSLGIKPLPEMSADDKYKGFDGGLYGGGSNEPPRKLLAAALAEAEQIRPLDRDGNPADNGKIVLISVGMSNTTQEFSQFVRMANRDADKSPRVVIVDCAQGGQEASDWARPQQRVRGDRPSPWEVAGQRLKGANVTDAQVQVAWIKQARRSPAALGEFPKHAEILKEDTAQILRMLKERFPNLRLAYLSSRIYAGFAGTPLNPEPYAFESTFSVRWLIEDQSVDGERTLNYDPQRGPVLAPLALWGPYLWGDGETPRKADQLVWTRDDFARDGTHPSDTGREKVARLLLEFFKSDPTAKSWFVESR